MTAWCFDGASFCAQSGWKVIAQALSFEEDLVFSIRKTLVGDLHASSAGAGEEASVYCAWFLARAIYVRSVDLSSDHRLSGGIDSALTLPSRRRL